MAKFKVTVQPKLPEGIHVSVRPKPEIVDQDKAEEVSTSIQELIVDAGGRPNNALQRRKLKKEMTELLEGFLKKGYIRPRR